MKLQPKNVKFLQQGGPIEDPNAAPVEGGAAPMSEEGAAPEQGGGDPLMQLAEMAMQALLSLDCNAAMAVCEGFVQLVQQAQGGAEAPQLEPVFRKGGKLAYRI